jgi:hypothetical protein
MPCAALAGLPPYARLESAVGLCVAALRSRHLLVSERALELLHVDVVFKPQRRHLRHKHRLDEQRVVLLEKRR